MHNDVYIEIIQQLLLLSLKMCDKNTKQYNNVSSQRARVFVYDVFELSCSISMFEQCFKKSFATTKKNLRQSTCFMNMTDLKNQLFINSRIELTRAW